MKDVELDLEVIEAGLAAFYGRVGQITATQIATSTARFTGELVVKRAPRKEKV